MQYICDHQETIFHIAENPIYIYAVQVQLRYVGLEILFARVEQGGDFWLKNPSNDIKLYF